MKRAHGYGFVAFSCLRRACTGRDEGRGCSWENISIVADAFDSGEEKFEFSSVHDRRDSTRWMTRQISVGERCLGFVCIESYLPFTRDTGILLMEEANEIWRCANFRLEVESMHVSPRTSV